MADPGLIAPRLRVTMDTGEKWDIQTANPDLCLWERTRAAKKWPAMQDSPFTWMTFLAWSASTREKRTDVPYEKFEQTAYGIVNLDADDVPSETVAEAFPTLAIPETVSASN
jgi:hypothetical protein